MTCHNGSFHFWNWNFGNPFDIVWVSWHYLSWRYSTIIHAPLLLPQNHNNVCTHVMSLLQHPYLAHLKESVTENPTAVWHAKTWKYHKGSNIGESKKWNIAEFHFFLLPPSSSNVESFQKKVREAMAEQAWVINVNPPTRTSTLMCFYFTQVGVNNSLELEMFMSDAVTQHKHKWG